MLLKRQDPVKFAYIARQISELTQSTLPWLQIIYDVTNHYIRQDLIIYASGPQKQLY